MLSWDTVTIVLALGCCALAMLALLLRLAMEKERVWTRYERLKAQALHEQELLDRRRRVAQSLAAPSVPADAGADEG